MASLGSWGHCASRPVSIWGRPQSLATGSIRSLGRAVYQSGAHHFIGAENARRRLLKSHEGAPSTAVHSGVSLYVLVTPQRKWIPTGEAPGPRSGSESVPGARALNQRRSPSFWRLEPSMKVNPALMTLQQSTLGRPRCATRRGTPFNVFGRRSKARSQAGVSSYNPGPTHGPGTKSKSATVFAMALEHRTRGVRRRSRRKPPYSVQSPRHRARPRFRGMRGPHLRSEG